MKAKIISCGILAALLSIAAFAQHTRLSGGGSVPAARMPNAVNATPSSPSAHVGRAGIAPSASTSPDVNVGHEGIAPDAQVGAAPNAQDGTNSTTKVKTPKSRAKGVPDTVTDPNAREFGNSTAVPY